MSALKLKQFHSYRSSVLWSGHWTEVSTCVDKLLSTKKAGDLNPALKTGKGTGDSAENNEGSVTSPYGTEDTDEEITRAEHS